MQKSLKVTSDQAKSINGLIENSEKEIAEMFKGGFDMGTFEKIANVRKDTKDKVLAVLTKDQRKAWREMIGEEFKLQQFGGFGFGKKKGNE